MLNYIENLYNERAKPFRIELIFKNIYGEREVKTTYANTLSDGIGEIAEAKDYYLARFESGRIFDDCGVNVFEVESKERRAKLQMEAAYADHLRDVYDERCDDRF